MKAMYMIKGQTYRFSDKPTTEVFEFSGVGSTGLMIVHPPGEPDMQSSWCLKPDDEVEPASYR